MKTTIEELYMIIGSYDVEIYELKKKIGVLESELNKERESTSDRIRQQRESGPRLVDFEQSTVPCETGIGKVCDSKSGPEGLR